MCDTQPSLHKQPLFSRSARNTTAGVFSGSWWNLSGKHLVSKNHIIPLDNAKYDDHSHIFCVFFSYSNRNIDRFVPTVCCILTKKMKRKKISIGLSINQHHFLKHINLPLFINHRQYFGKRVTNTSRESPWEDGVYPSPPRREETCLQVCLRNWSVLLARNSTCFDLLRQMGLLERQEDSKSDHSQQTRQLVSPSCFWSSSPLFLCVSLSASFFPCMHMNSLGSPHTWCISGTSAPTLPSLFLTTEQQTEGPDSQERGSDWPSSGRNAHSDPISLTARHRHWTPTPPPPVRHEAADRWKRQMVQIHDTMVPASLTAGLSWGPWWTQNAIQGQFGCKAAHGDSVTT